MGREAPPHLIGIQPSERDPDMVALSTSQRFSAMLRTKARPFTIAIERGDDGYYVASVLQIFRTRLVEVAAFASCRFNDAVVQSLDLTHGRVSDFSVQARSAFSHNMRHGEYDRPRARSVVTFGQTTHSWWDFFSMSRSDGLGGSPGRCPRILRESLISIGLS
jgi:hypothetical protein